MATSQEKNIDTWPRCGYNRIVKKRKENLLKVRIQVEEKESFQNAADLAGVSLSAWARERLRKVALLELKEAGQSIAFLKPAKNQG